VWAIVHRKYLLELLQSYHGADADEETMRHRMLSFVEQHEDCFKRELSIGHITGSAWIINPSRTKALMLHHRKLDRWLQPGGHSDGDPNTLHVALREASEESGIEPTHIKPVSENIFDIDIHTIPASKKEAQHEHFDVRFLLEIDDTLPLISNEESNELAWLSFEEVHRFNNDRSIERMLEKSKT
jgi:8-oxo-dGTP pyrophosphatase MutT (NUDIX family)